MSNKTNRRIYVRVPLQAAAILVSSPAQTIKAKTNDISQGGVAITAFSEKFSGTEYHIEILTEAGQRIEFSAKLVRADDSIAGFQILQIAPEDMEIIKELVFEYQKTIDFIIQIDEFNLLEPVDEEGKEIEITFEKGPNQSD